ncbi:ATP/GTP-binding protein [Streptomyces sp. NPDC001493]
MSDDDDGGTLVRGPWADDPSYVPPPMPDYSDTVPAPEDIPAAPPETPEETTMELPAIPAAPDPAAALRSEGIAPPEIEEESGEYEEGEYVQRRSLADRLGDWLELRLMVARDRHAGEAPFREAEIARKAALVGARTAQETAMMEQNAKLHAALAKAKGDRAAARSKADAARSSGSGLGADKGDRSKAGGGSGRGGGRGSGTNGSGSVGRGPGGGNSPGKGPDRPAGGGKGAAKGNESSGGPKGRQNGSGGPWSGKAGTDKGNSGSRSGSGSSGTGNGGSKGGGGKSKDAPAASPRAERVRGRQERVAARQAARDQRRGADQAAKLADRTKDRDQDRAAVQAAREERRKAKAERKAAGQAKREAAAEAKREAAKAATDDRVTLGAAVKEEAQRRWELRRAAEKDKAEKDKAEKDKAEKDGESKDGTGDKDTEATTEKTAKDEPEKPSEPSKDGSAAKEPGDGTKGDETTPDASAATTPDDGTGTDTDPKAKDAKTKGAEGAEPEPEPKPKANAEDAEPDATSREGKEEPADPSSATSGGGPEDDDLKDDPDDDRSFSERLRDRLRTDRGDRDGGADSRPGPGFDSAGAEDPFVSPGPGFFSTGSGTGEGDPFFSVHGEPLPPEWPDHPARPPRPAPAKEEDIVDAVVVDDPAGVHVSSPPGLPRAPEPHTQRPGTSRPTAQEDPVASQVSKPSSGQVGMAARHRTDVTFGEYLTEIVNIAIAAGLDAERAEELAVALGKVADALRDMAADLVGDHNIDTRVVDQITDLADAAARMKQVAERCATECGIASEAALLAAFAVGRTYSADMQAMEEVGLAHASSAAHHD